MTTELFPESAVAWTSLGEAYGKAGNRREAAAAWERAIALDPAGDAGRRARELLGKL
ncbi:tetratricopeptide repeat protein [Lewinella sp. IMCC34183]|uniref:tetratricopeptide repeat protein n=1 Tax=Lewinella sp. IMCC34183 TaxID=2248762 RepID=UPI00130027E9|nr:tetratricopeptide repeat protein [Lewinella sp. IMCC34183]